jgi:hypothetical protein
VMFVITHWVIIIGGGFAMVWLVPQWGSIGPWLAATTLIVFIGWLLWWRWHSRKWMAIDIFRHDAAFDGAGADERLLAEDALPGALASEPASG